MNPSIVSASMLTQVLQQINSPVRLGGAPITRNAVRYAMKKYNNLTGQETLIPAFQYVAQPSYKLN